jgi:hypothetical protein
VVSPIVSAIVSGRRKHGVAPSIRWVCATRTSRSRVAGVPRQPDLELGVTGAVHYPLREEPVEDPAGGVLDRARQIAGLDRAVAVLGQVVAQAGEEAVVAQLAPHHVQDPPALLVQVMIEDVDRLVVELGGDGPAITPAVLAEVAVQPLIELEIGGVATLVVLAPQILGVGREALVEPALAPVATGDQIAEPLVGQLVGDQRVDVVVDRGPGVEQDGVGQGRRAGVLHAAEDEVGGEDLGVARIRIGDAELP